MQHPARRARRLVFHPPSSLGGQSHGHRERLALDQRLEPRRHLPLDEIETHTPAGSSGHIGEGTTAWWSAVPRVNSSRTNRCVRRDRPSSGQRLEQGARHLAGIASLAAPHQRGAPSERDGRGRDERGDGTRDGIEHTELTDEQVGAGASMAPWSMSTSVSGRVRGATARRGRATGPRAAGAWRLRGVGRAGRPTARASRGGTDPTCRPWPPSGWWPRRGRGGDPRAYSAATRSVPLVGLDERFGRKSTYVARPRRKGSCVGWPWRGPLSQNVRVDA